MTTATSSALKGACGYCRPVFVHYPNMPREMRTTVTIALIIDLHFISVHQSEFFFFIQLCNLKTERFSDARHMIDLCTIYWQVWIFTHYPSVQAVQCHLGLVPVAEEWQPDNNKQPCISMWLKEKTNPLQFFTHTLKYILAKHRLVWWEGHVQGVSVLPPVSLSSRVRLCGFLHRIYWRA